MAGEVESSPTPTLFLPVFSTPNSRSIIGKSHDLLGPPICHGKQYRLRCLQGDVKAVEVAKTTLVYVSGHARALEGNALFSTPVMSDTSQQLLEISFLSLPDLCHQVSRIIPRQTEKT